MKDTLKIIVFSSLISLNVVIWYELLELNFAIGVMIVILAILLIG